MLQKGFHRYFMFAETVRQSRELWLPIPTIRWHQFSSTFGMKQLDVSGIRKEKKTKNRHVSLQSAPSEFRRKESFSCHKTGTSRH